MKRPAVQWTLAVVVTLASAVFQRMTGPTHPVRGRVDVGGAEVRLRLTRSHGGPGDQPIRIVAPDAAVTGTVAWRHFPTNEEWKALPMVRRGEALEAALPHQPPAGKLEYQVRLSRGGETAVFPARPAVTRFKGDVPLPLLLLHVAAMFAGMLLATAAGLRAVVPGGDPRRLAVWAAAVLTAGGFVLGPLVQKAAFGAYWTGIPFGWDLTDNKTLFAIAAWAAALVAMRGGAARARVAVAAAAVVTMVVFAIPHSVWGSQIDWSKVPRSESRP